MKLTYSYPRRTSFWIVTFIGVFLLLEIAGKFWRPGVGRVELGGIAVCLAGIWSSYLGHRRVLRRLNGQNDEKSLDRLSSAADSMGLLGFVALMLALTFIDLHAR
jgi:hypothetical protein